MVTAGAGGFGDLTLHAGDGQDQARRARSSGTSRPAATRPPTQNFGGVAVGLRRQGRRHATSPRAFAGRRHVQRTSATSTRASAWSGIVQVPLTVSPEDRQPRRRSSRSPGRRRRSPPATPWTCSARARRAGTRRSCRTRRRCRPCRRWRPARTLPRAAGQALGRRGEVLARRRRSPSADLDDADGLVLAGEGVEAMLRVERRRLDAARRILLGGQRRRGRVEGIVGVQLVDLAGRGVPVALRRIRRPRRPGSARSGTACAASSPIRRTIASGYPSSGRPERPNRCPAQSARKGAAPDRVVYCLRFNSQHRNVISPNLRTT